jgi:hypothetical protein
MAVDGSQNASLTQYLPSKSKGPVKDGSVFTRINSSNIALARLKKLAGIEVARQIWGRSEACD